MKSKYVLFGLELVLISLSIIFPEVVPFILIGIIIFFATSVMPRLLPVLLVILMGFNEIIPGVNLGNFSISPVQALILLSLFHILIHIIYSKRSGIKKFNNIFIYLLTAFYLLCIFSILQAIDKTQSLRYLRDLFFYISSAFVIIYWINNYTDLKRFLNIIKLTGFVVAFLGILQLIFKIEYGIFVEDSWWGISTSVTFFRIKSTFRDPNLLTNFLLLPFFISLSDLMIRKKGKDILIILVIFSNFILTNSRGGFLALFLGIIIFSGILYFRKGYKIKYAGIILTITALLIIMIISIPKEFLVRSITADNRADWSSIFRLYFIIVGLKIIAANMFWGIGINNFPIALKNYAPDVIIKSLEVGGKGGLAGAGYAHNTFLTIWAETGILNALVLIAIVIAAFYLIIKIKKNNDVEKNQKIVFYSVICGFIAIVIQILTITYISYHLMFALFLMIPIYNMSKKLNNKF